MAETPRQQKLWSNVPPAKQQIVFWLIVVAGLIADLWSKSAVFAFLWERPHAEYHVIDGFLKLVMRENDGAAFSIASGQRIPLIIISIAAFFCVTGIFLFGQIRRRIVFVALALFNAGILGNLYDRLFNEGRVRDFIDVYYRSRHWPAFNIADSMLCIAVGLLIISTLTDRDHQTPARQHKNQPQDQPPEQ